MPLHWNGEKNRYFPSSIHSVWFLKQVVSYIAQRSLPCSSTYVECILQVVLLFYAHVVARYTLYDLFHSTSYRSQPTPILDWAFRCEIKVCGYPWLRNELNERRHSILFSSFAWVRILFSANILPVLLRRYYDLIKFSNFIFQSNLILINILYGIHEPSFVWNDLATNQSAAPGV